MNRESESAYFEVLLYCRLLHEFKVDARVNRVHLRSPYFLPLYARIVSMITQNVLGKQKKEERRDGSISRMEKERSTAGRRNERRVKVVD